MLIFKKELLIEVGKRQDMDRIVQDIKTEIAEAEALYKVEYQSERKNEDEVEDVTSANVKKLEKKVASLASTVKDLF